MQHQYKLAFILASLTIVIALAEAFFSTYYGYRDESLTLFGFGVGSFIEIFSAIGVAHMIVRIQQNPESNRDNFERTALRITGFSFYVLVVALVLSGIYNFYIRHKPETTFSGIIISIASIILMLVLVLGKRKVGKNLHSGAILADAECTKVCIYMSLILLASSLIFQLTKFAFIDIIGTLALAYFSFREAKECFDKANSNKQCCDQC